jgi:hypothetical protein
MKKCRFLVPCQRRRQVPAIFLCIALVGLAAQNATVGKTLRRAPAE